MKDNIIVSICTLTYNHAPYLEDYFKSILSQKCDFKYEIIINDDCSTDGTQDILLDYAARYPDVVKVVIQEENQYSKGDRGFFVKYCFPRCSGKYIAFCEGDDCWTDPLKLQKQVDYLELHPECVLVHTDMDVKNISTGELYHGKWKRQKNFNLIERSFGTKLIPLLLQGRYSVTTLTACARHSALKSCLKDGLLIQDKKLLMGDTIMWVALASKGSFHLISDSCACYHVLPESASHSRNFSNVIAFYESCLYMIERLSSLYGISAADKNKAMQEYVYFLLNEVYVEQTAYLEEVQGKILNGISLNRANTLLLKTIEYNSSIKKIIALLVKTHHKLTQRCDFYKAKFWGLL